MSQTSTTVEQGRSEHATLVDLGAIDLSATVADRDEIGRLNPHRHEMALLDRVVWVSEDLTASVGVHRAEPDAFWVRGHFPEKALMPGVLQVEAGAQLACYQWNIRQDRPKVAAFLRIDDCAFRRSVEPGQALFLLSKEVKYGRRRFVTELQGVLRPGEADEEVAFEARITGMAIGNKGEGF